MIPFLSFVYLMQVLLCGYHEADIEHLMVIIYFTLITSITYKTLPFCYFHVFDINIYTFLYCSSINRLLLLYLFLLLFSSKLCTRVKWIIQHHFRVLENSDFDYTLTFSSVFYIFICFYVTNQCPFISA